MEFRRTLSMLMLSAMLTGCAHVYVDDQGRRHMVGLVWLTLPPSTVDPVGADALRTRALGLVLTRSAVGSGVVLGYSDTTLTVIRNDALVHLPAEPASSPKETSQ